VALPRGDEAVDHPHGETSLQAPRLLAHRLSGPAVAPGDGCRERVVPVTIRPLRFYLTLSGGASLGAYEAGAAAGLALAARYLDAEEGQETTVDAIGGASAGALVGFFTAHALLEGLDPQALLHETWVERVSLPLLRSGDPNALLTFDELRDRVPDVLAPDGPARADPDDVDYRQGRVIAMHVQITGLRGLTYPIRGLRRDSPVTGATYADWGRFELEPGGGLDQMLAPAGRSPLDFVLASAASPGGFAPQLLDRRPDADAYESHGIRNFPESGHLWYTDGGLLGSQPLGRVISAARALHGDEPGASGLHVLIDPRSESSSLEMWSDPDAAPSWQAGASRALAVLSEQSLFDDMRRIEKDNSRIEWVDRLADRLAEHLDDEAESSLGEFVAEVEAERAEMRADERLGGDERADAAPDGLPALLRRALGEVGGLVRKQRISIDVISPLLLADGPEDDVGSLLAGEFMGDFGGFLSRDLRASDFALGYRSTLAWLEQALPACELDDEIVRRTLSFVESRRRYDADTDRTGKAELSDLSLADRFELVRLGAHAVRVLGAGALDLRSRIPDALGRTIERTRRRLPGGGN
jgi:predicted acylesterase/phospholipase RssA